MNIMAKWILEEDEYVDGWEHHKCSSCDQLALYDYIMEEDWDEDMDGEWFSLGMRENGVNEHITPYCPHCGAQMDCTEALHRIYGCKLCKRHDEKSCNYGYTEECKTCGEYPWASDELESKWEVSE